MVPFDFTTTVAVSPIVIGVIVGLVQLIKGWLKKKIDGLADREKKFLDRLWIAVVGVLAVGAGCGIAAASGWPWWAAFPAALAYFVSAQGSYSSVKAALPGAGS